LLLAAVVVYIGWHIYDPSRALEVTLALLVISCPCALALAAPAALAAAHGTLARLGVLALGETAFERLAQVTDVVFDKTGTLSDGRPALSETTPLADLDRNAVLAIAAALESDSGHPLARAFADIPTPHAATGVRAVPGQGIEGEVHGHRWRLGRAGFAVAGQADDDALWLGDRRRAAARFRVQEA